MGVWWCCLRPESAVGGRVRVDCSCIAAAAEVVKVVKVSCMSESLAWRGARAIRKTTGAASPVGASVVLKAEWYVAGMVPATWRPRALTA